MQLTNVELLTSDYSKNDIYELVAVMQSTVLSTPIAKLRWEKVKPSDATQWLRQQVTKSAAKEFRLPRMVTMKDDKGLPSESHAEHLVVRDLDMEHIDSDEEIVSNGRIVAHADWRYYPMFSNHDTKPSEDANSTGATVTTLEGFGKDLDHLLDNMIETTLSDLFDGLPCFELRGISTLAPSHLRKGIAKQLVEWVNPLADQFSLPVILAASPLGLPLYRKCGYIEYRTYDVSINLKDWGGEGLHQHVVMVRWPADIESLPSAWKEWRKSRHVEA